jgi:hypothetical protein
VHNVRNVYDQLTFIAASKIDLGSLGSSCYYLRQGKVFPGRKRSMVDGHHESTRRIGTFGVNPAQLPIRSASIE